jgi:hypothetical protein
MLSRCCHNCAATLADTDRFCTHCGQKYGSIKISIWSLLGEFIQTIFNVDNKLWQSLGALFVPGKLTLAFLGGQRQRYFTPVRLFFVTGLLFFAVISSWGDKASRDFLTERVRSNEQDMYYTLFLTKVQEQSDTVVQLLPQWPMSRTVLDSLYGRMHGDRQDSTELGVKVNFGNGVGSAASDLRIAKSDLAELSVDSLVARYIPDESYWEKMILRQNIKLQREGSSFVGYFTSKLVWMMLLMMPVFALLLKLFYIRRGYFYTEHLVFSFHTHAFLFLVVGMAALLEYSNIIAENTLVGPSLLITWVYYLLAMRKVYRQSWGKTLIKLLLLNLSYIILFSTAFFLTLVATAALF